MIPERCKSLHEKVYGPYVVHHMPCKVTLMLHESTPARSSAIHKVIGAVISIHSAHDVGIADPAISRGHTG